MSVSPLYQLKARTASELSGAVERLIAEGRLPVGGLLPPVRDLAAGLDLSPTTVAAAYRALAHRGLVRGAGRRGTLVAANPALPIAAEPPVPSGVVDLTRGNPDPALLPALRPHLRRIADGTKAYGEPATLPALADAARASFRAEGVPADRVIAVSGALDGVERVLGAWLRPGDRVAAEDPGYPPAADLLGAMDLRVTAMRMDEFGVLPDALQGAVARGCQAVLFTPRAQAPTGAAWDQARAGELSEVLTTRPDVLVVEDDHAGPVSGVAARSVVGGSRRWATIRSVSKSLGPDLRLAVLAGDAVTVSRVEGRQALGTGWVSFLLQETVAELWEDPAAGRLVARAAAAYAERRGSLVDALARRGVPATGRSGLGVWVPVPDEPAITTALLQRGWAVGPGERFRIAAPPGIRIGIGTLTEPEASRLAADIADCLAPRARRTD